MYCLPSIEYVIGGESVPTPRSNDHSSLPRFALHAFNLPAASACSTRLPALVRIPPLNGPGVGTRHACFCVTGFHASSALLARSFGTSSDVTVVVKPFA